MPHTVVGVDLGSYSVKVAVLETSFRQAALTKFIERRVPAGEESDLTRAGAVLAELIAENHLSDAISYAAIPGDLISVRLLDLPFTDAKKIDQVVGFELESQIPRALEEVVLDHVVSDSAEGARVLAAAVPRETVREVLGVLGAAGLQPRALYAAPLCYGPLATRAFPSATGPVAVLDVGHQRTNVCIVTRGHVSFGRTISRGGRQLTVALAKAYQMRFDEAEQGKHQAGAVGSEERPLELQYALIDSTLRNALAPLIRDLRQTFSFYRSQHGVPIEQVLLCGGTARLRGLTDLIASETGIPTAPLALDPAELAQIADPEASHAELPAALAVGAAGATGRREVDFRRGEFGYRVDYSFLRAKSFHLAGCFLALLAFAAVDAYAALHKLRHQEVTLEARLQKATKSIFGKAVSDPTMVSQKIRTTVKSGYKDLPLPEATAYDLLGEISQRLKQDDEDTKLDVLELDIRPKKTFIKGTITSAAAVDEIVKSLKKIECFEDIQKGPIQNVVGREVKQFTLTIAGTCP